MNGRHRLQWIVTLGMTVCSVQLLGQQYTISTVAGGALPDLPALANVAIGSPHYVVTDTAGNAYFTSLNSVFRLDQTGVLSRVAGNSRAGFSGDGGPASSAQLSAPVGMAFDTAGNLYIADSGNNRIRRIDTSGVIVTIAGNGTAGFAGDKGPAVDAQFSGPAGVAVDTTGILYVADTGNNRVRKITPAGIITTVAGNGVSVYAGDGSAAINAQLSPASIAVDSAGNIFVSDALNYRIRMISAGGVISTVAGSGFRGYNGDGGAAVAAQLAGVGELAVDGNGNIFLADTGNSCIREVLSGSGVITTVVGIGANQFFGDSGQARNAALAFPEGVAFDGTGDMLIADTGNRRIRVVAPNGTIFTAAGNGRVSFSDGAGIPVRAQLNAPQGLAVDASGNLYFAESANNIVRQVSTAGAISIVAGNTVAGFTGENDTATKAELSAPQGLAVDSTGNLYIADSGNSRVREVSFQTIATVGGSGNSGFDGDGVSALSAGLSASSVAFDKAGNLYVGDPVNFRVRMISPSGVITTIAGNGSRGYSGDNGLAINAKLSAVAGVAADSSGNVYIADSGNHCIRKVTAGGVITTLVGTGVAGFSGDGGAASKAQLSSPSGVAVDASGNVFIADTGNNRVRMISAGGVITTVAGNGSAAYTGDGGFATGASLAAPYAVATGKSGIIYIADTGNNAIRMLTPNSATTLITAVVDAASESAVPVSPGKIVVIYGIGLGPSQLVVNSPVNGSFAQQLAGVTVSFRGTLAPLYYVSATQVAAIVPYELAGAGSAVVAVAYQGQLTPPFTVSVAASSPGVFTANASGIGQVAAVNVTDGSLNSAANPVKPGAYISLYATGEGQTTPASVDGRLAGIPLPAPILPVTATVGGVTATVQYKGAVYGAVAGLMQVNVLIPAGVTPGGYVPVALTVGNASTAKGSLWIAVSN